MLLYDIIERGSQKYPDRTAIIFRDSQITYGQLAGQVNRLADSLSKRGNGHGDRVAVLLPNCPPFTLVYYATTALGGVCVPANPLYKPAELAHIWDDSEVKVAFTAPPLFPHVQEDAKSAQSLQTIVSIGPREETPDGIPTLAELLDEGAPDFRPNTQH